MLVCLFYCNTFELASFHYETSFDKEEDPKKDKRRITTIRLIFLME